MFDLENNYLDEEDPWAGILEAIYFAVGSTYHTTLQSTPVHMVFGCNMILNTPSIDDWESISICEQELIDKNNQNENKTCKPHYFRVRDKVLVHNKKQKNMSICTKSPTQLIRFVKLER